jgi:hypothetical protein
MPTGSPKEADRVVEWDHEHRHASIHIYEYAGPADLLTDFFAMVDRLMDEKGLKL